MNILASLIISLIFTLGIAILVLGTVLGLILIRADSNRPSLSKTLSRLINLSNLGLVNRIFHTGQSATLKFTRLQTNDNGTIDLLPATRGKTASSSSALATPDSIPEKIKLKNSEPATNASNEEVHPHQKPLPPAAPAPRKKKISVSRHTLPAKAGGGISIQSQTHTAPYDEILQDAPRKFYLYSKWHPSPSGELPSQSDI